MTRKMRNAKASRIRTEYVSAVLPQHEQALAGQKEARARYQETVFGRGGTGCVGQ